MGVVCETLIQVRARGPGRHSGEPGGELGDARASGRVRASVAGTGAKLRPSLGGTGASVEDICWAADATVRLGASA